MVAIIAFGLAGDAGERIDCASFHHNNSAECIFFGCVRRSRNGHLSFSRRSKSKPMNTKTKNTQWVTCHFQDTHAKGIDIDLLIVLFVVELWSHELGGAEDRGDVGPVADDSESEVANLELSVVAVDEDIVTFEIAVDDGRVVGVEVDESLKDLATPGLEHLGLEGTLEGLFEVLLEGS